MNTIDVTTFVHDPAILEGSEWFLVVKSQDQSIRRERLLGTIKNGKYGRTETRPTSIGLLAKVKLIDGRADVIWKKEFPEPRHIIKYENDVYLLTDVSKVNMVDADGHVLDVIEDPLYAFIHSIVLNEVDHSKLLICSSGYDCVIETNIQNKNREFLWSAWENGFNPDESGNWLSLTEEYCKELEKKGKKSFFVDPKLYGEQGINTKFRSAHPNVAVYNPYNDNRSMVISIGHGGALYEVDFQTFETKLVFDHLSEMPHGLWPYEDGWVVTNTTKGEVWFLSADFQLSNIVSLAKLPGKPTGLGLIEWVQNTKVIDKGKFICLDANRGLIAVNTNTKSYNIYQPDPEWCLQDAIQASV